MQANGEGSAERTLLEIALHHGTDKASSHSYIGFYDDLLRHRRGDVRAVLEIGIGGFRDKRNPSVGGESLRTWRDYFPRATVVGLDILDKSGVADERIVVYTGSQVDHGLLHRIAERHGPFDLIVDDGSHVPAHVLTTFGRLFPVLKVGGVYVIEDLQTSYWPMWGGKFRPRAAGTSMDFLKRRVDGLNWTEFKVPGYHPDPLDREIVEVRFRHNIAAVIKGDNTAPSNLNSSHPMSFGRWVSTEFRPVVIRPLVVQGRRISKLVRRFKRRLSRAGQRHR